MLVCGAIIQHHNHIRVCCQHAFTANLRRQDRQTTEDITGTAMLQCIADQLIVADGIEWVVPKLDKYLGRIVCERSPQRC